MGGSNNHEVGTSDQEARVLMAIMSLGFTGTRLGMSQIQKDILYKILTKHDGVLHHGDCIGADAEAHDMAKLLGWMIHGHPPVDGKLRAFKVCDGMSVPKPYFVRNIEIVRSSEYLIACPKSREEKGGTWQTINWAKANNFKFTIILPDGTLGHSVLEVGKERIIG